MTIKEFIEKAIEGGWIYQDEKPMYNDTQKAPCIASFSFDGIDFGITLELIVLDPKAWEAVGKVEGWKNLDNMKTGSELRRYSTIGAFEKMHQMIAFLCQGGTIEEYVKTL